MAKMNVKPLGRELPPTLVEDRPKADAGMV